MNYFDEFDDAILPRLTYRGGYDAGFQYGMQEGLRLFLEELVAARDRRPIQYIVQRERECPNCHTKIPDILCQKT